MDHRDHVRAETERLLAVATADDPDVPVPACPGWTVRDLLGHVGQVQRFHGAHLGRGRTDPPPGPRPTPPADGLAEWVADGLEALLSELDRLGHDAPAWNFAGVEPMTTAFWHRRMALEAAVHRWDVEHARGLVDAAVADSWLPADLAVSGVEEAAEVWVPLRRARAAATEPAGQPARVAPRAGHVRIHLVDVDEVREVEVGGPEPGRAPAKPDAECRGSAARVLLVLWGRLSPEALDVRGDRALLAEVRAS